MQHYISFEDCLSQHGYPSVRPIEDGRIHRFGKEGKLWYVYYGSHAIANDWSGQLDKVFWQDKTKWDSFSKEEQARKRLEFREAQQEFERIMMQGQHDAAVQAKNELSKAFPITTHEYLAKKKLCISNGIFGTKEYILVPIFTVDGKLTSLQYIYANSKKKFLKNGRIKGCCHVIGSLYGKLDTVFICEGYATGLTVHCVTQKPVIVCFSANNIPVVLADIIKKYKANYVIAGDNDAYGMHNTGKRVAEDASKKFNCTFILPRFKDISSKPTDWNDLYCLEGSEEVLKQLCPVYYKSSL